MHPNTLSSRRRTVSSFLVIDLAAYPSRVHNTNRHPSGSWDLLLFCVPGDTRRDSIIPMTFDVSDCPFVATKGRKTPQPESPCVDHAVNSIPPQLLRHRRLDIPVQSAMLGIRLSPAARPVPHFCGCDSMAGESKSVAIAVPLSWKNTKHRHAGGRRYPACARFTGGFQAQKKPLI